MSEHFISELQISIYHLRSSDHHHLLAHGDEGVGHWYELFSSSDPTVTCGGKCKNSAQFILYTHYHNGQNDISTVCRDHASDLYIKLLDEVAP